MKIIVINSKYGTFESKVDDDFNIFSKRNPKKKRNISILKTNGKLYPIISGIPFHRYIMKPYKNCIDHIDGDTFNNQRSNFRFCLNSQNTKNRKIQNGNKTGFKGIHLVKRINSWRVMISVNDKTIHVGYTKDKIEAAKMYNEAAKKYYGEFAMLNVIP